MRQILEMADQQQPNAGLNEDIVNDAAADGNNAGEDNNAGGGNEAAGDEAADEEVPRDERARLFDRILQQNQDLINGMNILIARQAPPANPQRGATLENLSSSTPEKWMSFRQHFLAVLDTKTWTIQQAKRELKAAFRDEAANCITGIDFRTEDDEVTVVAILDLLERRFLAGRGTSRAIEDFRSATQASSETTQTYYGRLMSLYARAYPNGAGDTDINLINQFNQGLHNAQVRVHQCMRNHGTLENALQNACVAEAGVIQSQRLAGGRLNALGDPTTSQSPQIAAFGQPQQPGQYQQSERLKPLTPGACLVCSKPGHQFKDCSIHIALQRSMHLTRGSNRGGFNFRGQPRGRGSPRGNRGRQGPRGGGRVRKFNPRPSGLHALNGERPGPSTESMGSGTEPTNTAEEADMATEEEEEEDSADYSEYHDDNLGFGSHLDLE